jgi:uncharacterized protein (DUF1697 family)
MASHVAFLRGINVGRNKRIAMADLRALAADLGYQDVRTHLQSGNLILTCPERETKVAEALHGGIRDRFGFDVAVVVRTMQQLTDVVALDPFGAVATDPTRYFVTFFAADPSARTEQALDAVDRGDDQVHVAGREVYTWCPNGLLDSKLGETVLNRLPDVATTRNWRTVTKVLELAGG